MQIKPSAKRQTLLQDQLASSIFKTKEDSFTSVLISPKHGAYHSTKNCFTNLQNSQEMNQSSFLQEDTPVSILSMAGVKNKVSFNRADLISRANSSIRELSESNRLRSQQKIKNEEMCFQFKLKMISILRQLKFKSEEIDSLQSLSPENFILSFSHKLKAYLKEIEKNQEAVASRIKAHSHIIQQKTQQNSLLRRLIEQKESQWAHHKERMHKQLKQLRKQLFLKEEEITWLNIKIQQNINPTKKHKQGYLTPQKATVKDQHFEETNTVKLAKIIEQWKNELIRTVDEYQQILQQKETIIKNLNIKIKSLTSSNSMSKYNF